MKIEIAQQFTDELYASFEILLPQLAEGLVAPTPAHLKQLLSSDNTQLFVLRDEHQSIQGLLSFCTYYIPTGTKIWIEDVVVHHECRGKGFGKALVEAAITYAKEKGYDNINLTSSPHRKAANILYQRLGFEERKTNIYKLIL